MLELAIRDREAPELLAECWARQARVEPERAALFNLWIRWTKTAGLALPRPWIGRVNLFDWAGLRIIALPGEPFALTGLVLRERLGAAMVLAYADGCPGYLPPKDEYAFAGYEVDDAHRYYGMPAPFAPGSAEQLADAAAHLVESLGT
jgi:hypothetical protein